MSKTNDKVDYRGITPELVKQVAAVIAESEKNHRYSVSRVYAAYNAAFGKNEKPQTCSSCLYNRVRELKAWMRDYQAATQAPESASYELAEGGTILIGGDGKVHTEDGKGLIPGKYSTKDGGTVIVAPGSKGRYEAPAIIPQYDDPEAPGYVPHAEGTVRYPMADGIPLDFLPNEGTIVKGVVTRADGSAVEPGTYVTAEGLEIVVQPDGVTDIITPDDLI